MTGKGRPPKIPPQDIPQIIDDIVQGRRKKSEIARHYGVTQASLDGLMKRQKERRGVNDEDLKGLPELVQNHLNSFMEFESNFAKYKNKYGDDLWNYHYNLQVGQRLRLHGYDETISLLKKKINKALSKDTVTVMRSIGEGGEMMDERPVDIQDAKYFKDIASTISSLTYTEGIHKKEPLSQVAIQNTQSTAVDVDVTNAKKEERLESLKQSSDFQEFVKAKVLD